MYPRPTVRWTAAPDAEVDGRPPDAEPLDGGPPVGGFEPLPAHPATRPANDMTTAKMTVIERGRFTGPPGTGYARAPTTRRSMRTTTRESATPMAARVMSVANRSGVANRRRRAR